MLRFFEENKSSKKVIEFYKVKDEKNNIPAETDFNNPTTIKLIHSTFERIPDGFFNFKGGI
ncbi:hypothetical protein [Erwinia oleae]|uniref:hypothetical protein n=1 Tax=Erwinia oleae TaxID=796334 RepID=UPI00054F9329|nr:hypothetical protein [Erwinia oleae]